MGDNYDTEAQAAVRQRCGLNEKALMAARAARDAAWPYDSLEPTITAYLSALPAGEVGQALSALRQMAFAWGQPSRAGVMLPFLGASTTDEAAKVVTEAATALTSLSARIAALEAENERLRKAATRVLEWAGPIAGDNQDDIAAREEEESVAELEVALSRAREAWGGE